MYEYECFHLVPKPYLKGLQESILEASGYSVKIKCRLYKEMESGQIFKVRTHATPSEYKIRGNVRADEYHHFILGWLYGRAKSSEPI